MFAILHILDMFYLGRKPNKEIFVPHYTNTSKCGKEEDRNIINWYYKWALNRLQGTMHTTGLNNQKTIKVLPAWPGGMAAQHEDIIIAFNTWRINIKASPTRHEWTANALVLLTANRSSKRNSILFSTVITNTLNVFSLYMETQIHLLTFLYRACGITNNWLSKSSVSKTHNCIYLLHIYFCQCREITFDKESNQREKKNGNIRVQICSGYSQLSNASFSW